MFLSASEVALLGWIKIFCCFVLSVIQKGEVTLGKGRGGNKHITVLFLLTVKFGVSLNVVFKDIIHVKSWFVKYVS